MERVTFEFISELFSPFSRESDIIGRYRHGLNLLCFEFHRFGPAFGCLATLSLFCMFRSKYVNA
jgi:hypothetical protein